MTKRIKRKISLLLLNIQLLFTFFLPLSPLIPQALASEEAPFAIEQIAESYNAYYLVNGVVFAESVDGKTPSFSSQSGEDKINYDVNRLVIKTSSKTYLLEAGKLVDQHDTDSVDLSTSDKNFLYNQWTVNDRLAETKDQVELGVEYSFPLNEEVKVTFNKLPEERSALRIEEVVLSEELQAQLGTVSEYAYDITTDMNDGEFEFDLVLPIDEDSEKVDVKYAETVEELGSSAKGIEKEVKVDGGKAKVEAVDHMTIFVVIDSSLVGDVIGEVDGFVGADGSGVISGWTNGDFNTVISGIIVDHDPTFSQWIKMSGTISGDINGSLNGGVNYNGFDTLFTEITGSGLSGYVYLIGSFYGAAGEFKGRFVQRTTPIDFITDISISGDSVELGKTLQMLATTSPTEAGDDVAWSVWVNESDPIYGRATIDEVNGLLKGTAVGKVTVIASALDGSLLTKNHTVNVLPDTTAPVIAVTSPNGDFYPNDNILIQGTATDENGIDKVQMHIANTTTGLVVGCTSLNAVVTGSDWSLNLADVASCNLTEGEYEIRAWAYDNTGNPGWANRPTFTVDTTKPTGKITAPATGTIITVANVHVEGWAKDNLSGIKQVRLFLRNRANYSIKTSQIVANWDGTNFWGDIDTSLLPDGEYDVVAIADDNAGNNKWLWPRPIITVDNTAPDVEITSPLSSLFNGTIEVRGSVTDDNPHHYWLVIVDSNGTKVAGPGTVNESSSFTDIKFFDWDTTAVDDGEYTIKLEARDAANNKDAGSRVWKIVTVDNTPPEVPTLLSPANNSYQNGASLLSDWTDVLDANNYIYESYHDEKASNLRWHAEYTQSQKSASNVANSIFWWRVKAVDAIGNESAWSDLWKVTIDNDAPTVTVDALNTNDNTPELTGTVSDNYGIATIEVTVDGQVLSAKDNNDGTWTLADNTLSALADGLYDVSVKATDLAGNESFDSTTDELGIDTTKPVVDSAIDPSTPDGNNSWYRTQPTITVTATDAGSLSFNGVAKIEYQWDSSSGSWTEYTSPVQPLTEGTHTLYFRAFDKLGNESLMGQREVKWDQTAPDPGPENLKITNLSLPTATLEWDAASDSISGIEKYDISWKLKGTAISHGDTVGAGDTSVGLDNLSDGEWEIRVKALDNAGNWTETLLLYTIGGGTGTAGESTTTSSNPPAAVLGVATGFAASEQRTGEVEGAADEATEEEQAAMIEEMGGEVAGTNSCEQARVWFWFGLALTFIITFFAAFLKEGWQKILAFILVPAIIAIVYSKFLGGACFDSNMMTWMNEVYWVPAYLTAIMSKLVTLFFIED